MFEETPELIAQHYKASMDSVSIINGEKPEYCSDEDWVDNIARNKAHLQLMLSKTFWTTEDLTPIQNASV